MKAVGYIKKHSANEFYVKKCRGYYLVIDGYDKSMASLECTEQAANEMAAKLNEMRNKRFQQPAALRGCTILITTREDGLVKKVQRLLGHLINDEGIRSLLVKLVQSGMTPEQVANYVREIVIKYVLLTDNY